MRHVSVMTWHLDSKNRPLQTHTMSTTLDNIRWCAGLTELDDGIKPARREIILTHRQAKWLLRELNNKGSVKRRKPIVK